MSRFQAKTDDVLDGTLEDLRRKLGLRSNQKVELLKDMTALAAWIVREVSSGRSVVSRGDDDFSELDHPVVERLKRLRREVPVGSNHLHMVLDDEEVRKLTEILDLGRSPPPALLAALRNLTDPDRSPPDLVWPETS